MGKWDKIKKVADIELLDVFAGLAMVALLIRDGWDDETATYAYTAANAMMEERDERKG